MLSGNIILRRLNKPTLYNFLRSIIQFHYKQIWGKIRGKFKPNLLNNLSLVEHELHTDD